MKHQIPKDPDYEDTVKALEIVSGVVEGADEQVKQEVTFLLFIKNIKCLLQSIFRMI